MGSSANDRLNFAEFGIKDLKTKIRERFSMYDKYVDTDKFEDMYYYIMQPFLIIGKIGIGKTVSMTEVAKELGIGYKEVRLAMMTETDLVGLPYLIGEGDNKRTTFASNALLPFTKEQGGDDPDQGILVLDEITSCQRSLRAAALQLLDSKRAIGNYKLPKGWLVVALGNGPDDGGICEGLEFAVLSRCACCRAQSSFKDWRAWAIDKGVNPSVIAYLEKNPDNLHRMPDDIEEYTDIGCAIPTPRTWTALGMLLNMKEEISNELLSEACVQRYAELEIGAALAGDFSAFYGFRTQLVDPDEILEKGDKATVKALSNELKYFNVSLLTNRLNYRLKEDAKKNNGVPSVEGAKLCGRAYNWLIAMSDKHLNGVDFASTALSDLGSIPQFVQIYIGALVEPDVADTFQALCPGIDQYIDDHKVVANMGIEL